MDTQFALYCENKLTIEEIADIDADTIRMTAPTNIGFVSDNLIALTRCLIFSFVLGIIRPKANESTVSTIENKITIKAILKKSFLFIFFDSE